MEYIDFLKSKMVIAAESGFEVEDSEINQNLKPHQRDAVRWAVRGGRRALFESFGLGKTAQELEWCRIVIKREGGQALIVLPLGVRQEFKRDAVKLLGMSEPPYVRNMAEVRDNKAPILMTNYERVRDGDIDPTYFTATSLDEASVLRSYGSKTYQTFMDKFAGVRYKLVATATPSPNKYKELIHYAGYLDVMDTGQALTRFFQRDSQKANNLTIYPHKEEEFWLWVSTWALFIGKPSDLGYDDTGYDMPDMEIIYHEIPVDNTTAGTDQYGQVKLIRDAAIGLKDAAREKRESIDERVQKIMEVIKNDRSKARISAPVLFGKPGEATYCPEGTQQKELSRKQGIVQNSIKIMEGIQPGANEGASASSYGGEQRCQKRKIEAVVSREQASGQQAVSQAETRIIRPDGAGLQENVGATGREMRYMSSGNGDQGQENQPVCGSLSRDGEGEGASLSEMQCGAGDVLGQSNSHHESSGLPDQIIIWCELNAEQAAIEKALNNKGISYISLYGSQDPDKREKMLAKWLDKEVSVLITKPEMYGSGVNLQQCHTMFFVGINYQFEDFIQGVHRIYRFLQKDVCNIHVIYMESEREIMTALKAKWARHEEMQAKMAEILQKYGLSNRSVVEKMGRSIGVQRMAIKGKHYTAVLNDCIDETARMDDNSVDMILTSIPFSNHYEYTPSYNDLGHNEDTDKFFQQMDFLAPNLLRVLKPGRIYACHTKDRVLFGNATGTGMPTIEPFHALTIQHYMKHGFQYIGMITVVTDVVRENNQTYRLGWSEQCKDGSKMGVGCPEYILLFRKLPTSREKAYADVPVVKSKEEYTRAQWQLDAHGYWRSSGDRLMRLEEIVKFDIGDLQKAFNEFSRKHVYDYQENIDVAKMLESMRSEHGGSKLPATFMVVGPASWNEDVWDDILRMRTLNSEQVRGRRQMHVCPLQIDIVERLINRYTNPGETVYDPFGGLMTTPVTAVKMGRYGIGCELNPDYFRDGLGYLKLADEEMSMPSLFDFLEAAQ